MTDPTPGYPGHAAPATPKVEKKVSMATLGAYAGGVVILALVNMFTDNDNQLLIATLPDVIEPFILPIVPAAVSFVLGWAARHTPRPDLGQN